MQAMQVLEEILSKKHHCIPPQLAQAEHFAAAKESCWMTTRIL